MVRLTRAEAQERNRAKVLAAARDEFVEHGFRDAKIDRIAERAELTRGAVYSNFPGKRALYFAVLAEAAEPGEQAEPGVQAEPGEDLIRTPRQALGALARAWVARLPLATDEQYAAARLGVDLMSHIETDERLRRPYTQLTRLHAIVLGLALERLAERNARPAGGGTRLVRVAEGALTILHGASRLSAAAPGFVEPFNVVRMCEQLADLDLGDLWPPPPVVPPAQAVDEPWTPPKAASEAVDVLREVPAQLAADGVVAVLGLHRLSAIEDAVRAAPAGSEVSAVVVTGDRGELGPLTRLAIAELRGSLREAFPPSAWPALRIVLDDSGRVAARAGVPAVSDATETAVRVENGRIVARAEGLGACHAAATFTRTIPRERRS